MAPRLSAAISQGTFVLAEAGIDSPRADARALAEYVIGVPLYAAGPDMSDAQWTAYLDLVGRRASRIPLQHLTGRMYFRFLTLAARPGVFVVRPETEWVAGEAIEWARRLARQRRVCAVDWCAGSGAIGLALASEVAGVDVSAVEIDSGACALAAENAAANPPAEGSMWRLVHADATAPETLRERDGRVDLVVTNPPYVPEGGVTQPEAAADPALALYGGGVDGLAIPRALLARAWSLLAPGGLLVMEHAESQAEALVRAARAAGFTARTGTDLAGRPRCLLAERPRAPRDMEH